MKPEVETEAMRITQQFRSGEAMIYDLRGSAGRLTLRITGRAGDDGPPTEWRIEASTSSSPDAVVVAEQGATRAEALRAVGRSWNEKRLASNLPSLTTRQRARRTKMTAQRWRGGRTMAAAFLEFEVLRGARLRS
jgi:hypothetical protein